MRPLRMSLMAAFSVVGRDAGVLQDLAPPRVAFSARGQQQPLDGDELVAGLVGDLLGLVEYAGELRREIDAGRRRRPRPWAAWRAHARPRSGRRLALPPAAGSGRRPCPPGRRAALSRGARAPNCWWPSRMARPCADWTKPLARSVYFSGFIYPSWRAPFRLY